MECRRYPPAWPQVRAADWCGEFRPADALPADLQALAMIVESRAHSRLAETIAAEMFKLMEQEKPAKADQPARQ